MPEFITLTSDKGFTQGVNTSMIWRFFRDAGERITTLLYIGGAERYVKETPEQILAKIEASHCEITVAEPQEAWRSMLPGGGP